MTLDNALIEREYIVGHVCCHTKCGEFDACQSQDHEILERLAHKPTARRLK